MSHCAQGRSGGEQPAAHARDPLCRRRRIGSRMHDVAEDQAHQRVECLLEVGMVSECGTVGKMLQQQTAGGGDQRLGIRGQEREQAGAGATRTRGAVRGGEDRPEQRCLDGHLENVLDGDPEAGDDVLMLVEIDGNDDQEALEHAQDHSLPQRRLGPELVVHGLAAHPHPRGDLRHRDRRPAGLGGDLGCRVDEPLTHGRRTVRIQQLRRHVPESTNLTTGGYRSCLLGYVATTEGASPPARRTAYARMSWWAPRQRNDALVGDPCRCGRRPWCSWRWPCCWPRSSKRSSCSCSSFPRPRWSRCSPPTTGSSCRRSPTGTATSTAGTSWSSTTRAGSGWAPRVPLGCRPRRSCCPTSASTPPATIS